MIGIFLYLKQIDLLPQVKHSGDLRALLQKQIKNGWKNLLEWLPSVVKIN